MGCKAYRRGTCERVTHCTLLPDMSFRTRRIGLRPLLRVPRAATVPSLPRFAGDRAGLRWFRWPREWRQRATTARVQRGLGKLPQRAM